MNSFEEIVKYAISLEEEAAQFYARMAGESEKPEIKKVFEEMRLQEVGHKKKLELVLERHKLPEVKLSKDDDLKISDYVKPVEIDQPNLSYQDALVVGMKLEQTSEKLYRSLAASAQDPEIKQIFDYLAEEEGKHKFNFESKFDDLM